MPDILSLAKDLSDKFTVLTDAKTKADASTAAAAADQAAEVSAHSDVRAAIDVLEAAAESLDPKAPAAPTT